MLGDILRLFREGKFQEMDEKLADLAEKEEKALAAPAAAPVATEGEDAREPYPFEDGVDYRVHFKNGCSGEYSGSVLARQFPFDPEQVESVERIGGEVQ